MYQTTLLKRLLQKTQNSRTIGFIMADSHPQEASFLTTEEALLDYFALLRTRTPENYLVAQAFLDPVLFPEQLHTPTEDIAEHIALVMRHDQDMDYEELSLRGHKVAVVYSLLTKVATTPSISFDHIADITKDATQTVADIDMKKHLTMPRRKEIIGVMNRVAAVDDQTVRVRASEIVRHTPPAGVRGAVSRYFADMVVATNIPQPWV
jgi:hypothetical protein